MAEMGWGMNTTEMRWRMNTVVERLLAIIHPTDDIRDAITKINSLETLCALHWRTIQDANKRAEKAEAEGEGHKTDAEFWKHNHDQKAYLLSELFAMVQGEVPSLLEGHHLYAQIKALEG